MWNSSMLFLSTPNASYSYRFSISQLPPRDVGSAVLLVQMVVVITTLFPVPPCRHPIPGNITAYGITFWTALCQEFPIMVRKTGDCSVFHCPGTQILCVISVFQMLSVRHRHGSLLLKCIIRKYLCSLCPGCFQQISLQVITVCGFLFFRKAAD